MYKKQKERKQKERKQKTKTKNKKIPNKNVSLVQKIIGCKHTIGTINKQKMTDEE